jgi:hypothetical protein
VAAGAPSRDPVIAIFCALAGQVARAVLEEHGQFAEVRVEHWDPSGGEWRDPDEPAEHEDRPEPGRLQTTAIAFVKGAGQALARGDLA